MPALANLKSGFDVKALFVSTKETGCFGWAAQEAIV